MKWISFKDRDPILNQYVLLTDGRVIRPYFVDSLAVFMPEQDHYLDAVIKFADGTRLKVHTLTSWAPMPDPVNPCYQCEHIQADNSKDVQKDLPPAMLDKND